MTRSSSRQPAPARLYPHQADARLNEALFRCPSAEYRGTPFWSWNGQLDRVQLERQMDALRDMGFGGFHLHARTGLATPYLGEEFMALVRSCTEKAARDGLLSWLYDEDRWPSGFAGGFVTSDERFRMKYLLFTRTPYGRGTQVRHNVSCGRGGREENGRLLARYAVTLDAGGALQRYARLAERARVPRGAQEWFAYLETAGGVPWFNHQTYVDTLNPAAIARFVELTHEPYRRVVGDFFGGTIPAIFTDEPQHLFKEYLTDAHQPADVTLPATDDFFSTYREAHGHDLLEHLPELFWELPGSAASPARYHYHNHVTQRFADAYARTLGAWCEHHGLLLTGHMMDEPTLSSQTRSIGEAMRSLAHFQLPGIDLLCDRREYTTAKQAQSVAHQYGRPGVLSELYGVTGWHYDFVGYKAQGDWQAALGITVRVPHLALMSMAGESKRDYPASIHYQAPWSRDYTLIEDHFARVNVVLTRGRPSVRVAVIHPIESYWLCHGPLAQTKAERDRRDRQFVELPQWLLHGLIDFDYVCEALLPEQPARGGGFAVGEMHYDIVVVPALRTIRRSTLARLEGFAKAGGTVVFAGEIPTLVDAAPSTRPQRLAARARRCAWDRDELLRLLEPAREIDCTDRAGMRPDSLLYQLRSDGKERHVFLVNTDRQTPREDLSVSIRGSWRAYLRDTFTGEAREQFVQQLGGKTLIPLSLPAHGHALLTLRPGRPARRSAPRPVVWRDLGELPDPVPVTLSEPNVLLLDQAEWRWNDEPWQPREELLRVHNHLRARCGLAPQEGNVAQPWADAEPVVPLGRLSLRFAITSDVDVPSPELALEQASDWEITWDGVRVDSSGPKGWWVDEAIQRVPLPAVRAGRHELTLACRYTRKREVEWAYLLGDFGVALAGRHARLTAPVRELAFGDWTRQGLPFYAGNVTYHARVTAPATTGRDELAIHFPHVSAPLLRVARENGASEPVAFAPHRVALGKRSPGPLTLDLTAYGNRHNAFGPLHRIATTDPWTRPSSWRTVGADWAYEYQLRPMGILTAPRLQLGRRPAE